MKRLHGFLQCVLEDLGRWCCTSTTNDLKTVIRRIEGEGISFITITLPNFGKDFERCLDQGQVDPLAFQGFKRKAGLPAFMRGFLEQIFDSSGAILSTPSITAIWAIRQFTLMFAKMSIPCSNERTEAAIRRYVECDQEVRETQDALWGQPNEMVASYRRLATLLWADTLVDVERKLLAVPSQIIPKHGPGATAERTYGNDKWVQQEWTDRLEQVFPAGEHLATNWSFYQEAAGVQYREPGTERPVRVITVPKTLKTPRIIAIEPVCMQYVQQGLLAAIEQSLRQDELCWGFVGWRSQVLNQHLASEGSRDQTLATLDLSEASDRVSEQHVRDLLRTTPSLREGVDSCRSRKAAVPGYGDITLAKFASMGSALCFPFEAMVFLTVVFAGIEKQNGHPLTRKDIKSFAGKVRVYGDDIIVPRDYVRSVIAELELHGFKVNAGKSFWTGKFRESCGKEYYDGQDVSIVRLRSVFPSSLRDGTEVVSTVATRNLLYKAGLWGSAGYLDRMINQISGNQFPHVSEESPVLGRHSFLVGPDLTGKLHKDTHQPLVRGMMIRVNIPASPLDDHGALLKCLTRLELDASSPSRDPEEGNYFYRDPEEAEPQLYLTPKGASVLLGRGSGANIWELQAPDVRHLDRSGRPRSVNIKIGVGPSA